MYLHSSGIPRPSPHLHAADFVCEAGIAARIRTNDYSSFMLEEHSSRALNFKAPWVSDTAPISLRSDAVGKWTSQNTRRSPLDSEVEDSFSSIVISASDATGASEGSSVSSGEAGSHDSSSKSAERPNRHSRHVPAKMASGSTESKYSKPHSRRNSTRSKARARKNRLSREKSALSRLLAFMTRKTSSKNVPAESTKNTSDVRSERLTPESSVSSMEIPSQLFGKPRKSAKLTQAKPQPSKTGSTSCFPYSVRDEVVNKGHAADRKEKNDTADAYDSFTVSRKKSQWKVGRAAPRSAQS